MKNIWWFCPLLLLFSCMPQPASGEWDGKYIGYYHKNQQDTTLVNMVFAGKFFAVAPHYASDGDAVEGTFEQQPSSIVFHHGNNQVPTLLEGTYQYQFSNDGTVRLWQETGSDFREIILRQQ